jgi:hypothetical protein
MDELFDDEGAPPWPGMKRLDGAVVRIPACALWAEHESYASPCWIEAQAQPAGELNAAAPTVAQLLLALSRGAITAAAGAEQTSSALTIAGLEGWREPACAELLLGPQGVALARGGAPASLVRKAAPLSEARRPWRQLVRPCAARSGRGESWPPVCERLGRSSVDEPVLLDRGDMVAQVYEDEGWTLVAAGADDHALSWVPSDALDEWVDEWVGAWLPASEADEGELAASAGGEGEGKGARDAGVGEGIGVRIEVSSPEIATARPPRTVRPSGEAPPVARKLRREVSDAPLYDAILALAESAVARLSVRESRGHAPPAAGLLASAELWPGLVAELLEAWADAAMASDERLAALSAIDIVLTAIAVAPALDRATARRYRALAAPEPLTAGLVIDLAGGSAATRVRLGRRLARELPLRAGDVVRVAAEAVPMVTSELMVAPWLVAACYGV